MIRIRRSFGATLRGLSPATAELGLDDEHHAVFAADEIHALIVGSIDDASQDILFDGWG